jgi:CRP/FNR family transcriptional regulator, cyclic AMP receptor protein
MPGLDELIADAPVFANLAPEQVQQVAGCARTEQVDAGTMLFREGGQADRFFLIRTGAVALEIAAPGRDALVISTLQDGEVVGWSWLFPPYRWHFDGRVTVPAGLVTFDASCLRGKCDADPNLGYQLMQRFAASIEERLQATRLQLLDVYGHAVAG